MIPFWKNAEHARAPVVALSAEVPPEHTVFLALGEQRAREILQRATQRLTHLAAAQGGIVVRADGSSLLALFERAETALHCAQALRRDLARWVRPLAPEVDAHVDIGLSWGRLQGHPPDYEGATLAQANTLAAAASGGQILLDAAVVQQLPALLRETLRHVRRLDPVSGLTQAWMMPPPRTLSRRASIPCGCICSGPKAVPKRS
jgi:class 3 adenylate cyclase